MWGLSLGLKVWGLSLGSKVWGLSLSLRSIRGSVRVQSLGLQIAPPKQMSLFSGGPKALNYGSVKKSLKL